MSEWTGSKYAGPIREGWFHTDNASSPDQQQQLSSTGTYAFKNGVKYEGEFRNGEFHGKGNLIYPHGGRFEGIWERGIMTQGRS
jgi:hypothetical protein